MVVLRQVDDKSFEVRCPFRYDLPDGSASYIVPRRFRTDLASVPWLLWWLVASYGHHTRAALLHDTLVGDDAVVDVPRKDADWVFYTALEDPDPGEKKGSWLRHKMTWVAVCVFGTMRKCAPGSFALFLLNVALFWFALIAGIVGVIDSSPWWPSWVWWVVAGALAVGGLLWTFNPQADRRLAIWLWPVGAGGLALVTPAVFFAGVTVLVVAIVDLPSVLFGNRRLVIHPYRLRFPA